MLKSYLGSARSWPRGAWLVATLLVLGVPTLLLPGAPAGGEGGRRETGPQEAGPVRLAAVRAVGLSVDTLLIGGYARGSFREAVSVLAGDLSPDDQALVGTHLQKVFAAAFDSTGLGRTGRLRLAFERARRPDGSTRSVRVLAAEAAVAGKLHTAFYFERDGRPGYFDPFGRSLDPATWLQPLESARISSRFGSRRMHPILRRVLPHTGVDYAAASGTPVRATGDGIVSVAGRRGGYGTMVEIRHPNGYATRYAHLSAVGPGVRVGHLVQQGEMVGRVGMTGLATGPHLHYEVRRQGQPVDPTRIAATPGATADLGAEPDWASERGRLSGLLARAPTVLRVR